MIYLFACDQHVLVALYILLFVLLFFLQQSLSVIHRTVTNVLRKDATGQNGEQTSVDSSAAQGFSPTLSNPSQTESTVHDSTVGQADSMVNTEDLFNVLNKDKLYIYIYEKKLYI